MCKSMPSHFHCRSQIITYYVMSITCWWTFKLSFSRNIFNYIVWIACFIVCSRVITDPAPHKLQDFRPNFLKRKFSVNGQFLKIFGRFVQQCIRYQWSDYVINIEFRKYRQTMLTRYLICLEYFEDHFRKRKLETVFNIILNLQETHIRCKRNSPCVTAFKFFIIRSNS